MREVKKMKLSDLEFDERVYPRPEKSRDNITTLIKKLMNGIELDPMTVQPVIDGDARRTVVLDGGHRIKAYKEFNKLDNFDSIREVPVKLWKDEVISFEENIDEMLIFAHQVNDKQGLNVRGKDTKYVARSLKRRNPNWTGTKIAEKLNRHQSTINQYIKDARKGEQTKRDSKIVELSNRGWTQKEIASHFDLTRSRVSQIVNSLDITKINELREKNKEKIISEIIWSIPSLSEDSEWEFSNFRKDTLVSLRYSLDFIKKPPKVKSGIHLCDNCAFSVSGEESARRSRENRVLDWKIGFCDMSRTMEVGPKTDIVECPFFARRIRPIEVSGTKRKIVRKIKDSIVILDEKGLDESGFSSMQKSTIEKIAGVLLKREKEEKKDLEPVDTLCSVCVYKEEPGSRCAMSEKMHCTQVPQTARRECSYYLNKNSPHAPSSKWMWKQFKGVTDEDKSNLSPSLRKWKKGLELHRKRPMWDNENSLSPREWSESLGEEEKKLLAL